MYTYIYIYIYVCMYKYVYPKTFSTIFVGWLVSSGFFVSFVRFFSFLGGETPMNHLQPKRLSRAVARLL